MTGFNLPNKIIPRTFFAILLVGCIVALVGITKRKMPEYKFIEMDSGWDFSYNGKVDNNITISQFSFDMTNKGDVICISKNLPDDIIEQPAIKFRIFHCIVTVKLDDKVIFTYGQDAFDKGKAVGSGMYLASLPKDYQGKKIELIYNVTEDNAFPSIEAVELINEHEYVKSVFCKQMIDVISGSFAIIVGFLAILFTFFRKNLNGYSRRLIWLGLLSINIGGWIHSSFGITMLYIENRTICSYIEYGMLYLCVPSMGLLFYEMLVNKVLKRISLVLSIASATLTLVATICSFFNVFHLSAILTQEQLLGIVTVVTSGIFAACQYKKLQPLDKMITRSMGILVLVMVFELVRFNIFKYIFKDGNNSSYLSAGIFAFIVMVMISYLVYSKEYIDVAVEKGILTKMAYKDMLTGLDNRSVIMDKLDEMDKNKVDEFAILNFDLNGLKKINDENGHFEGDRYIMEFTDIFKDCLEEIAYTGRVGGDEFIAIIEAAYSECEVKKIIDKMNAVLKQKNSRNIFGWTMSFSYGYAVSDKEKSLNVWEAYDKADGAMYECKRRQKAK